MTDDEQDLVLTLRRLVNKVRVVVDERDQLQQWVKDLQSLTIDQQLEIEKLKRELQTVSDRGRHLR